MFTFKIVSDTDDVLNRHFINSIDEYDDNKTSQLPNTLFEITLYQICKELYIRKENSHSKTEQHTKDRFMESVCC